eukprot:TRINITY_DN11098_c0_g2_i1.p1 TRINITY_DN11098_c0_g2~~TRINITY_DN11098_c0_g2_i1.p1  ORF type:complete len:374 (-),score=105.92 TRINITY_DN11098_c0_g2_i1:232-1353(-)
MATNGSGGGGGGGGDKPVKKPQPKFAPRVINRPKSAASGGGLNSKLPGALPDLLGATTVKLESGGSSQPADLNRERAIRGGRGRGRDGASERGRGPRRGEAPSGLNAPRVAFVASNTQSRSSGTSAVAAPSLARQIKPSASRTRSTKQEDDDGMDGLLKEEEEYEDDGSKRYEPIDYFGEVVTVDEEEAAGKLKVKAKPAAKKLDMLAVEEAEQAAAVKSAEMSLHQFFHTANIPAFIQFPSKFPKIPPKPENEVSQSAAKEAKTDDRGAEVVVDTDEANAAAAAAASAAENRVDDLSTFGTGQVGALRLYRSGKVKLVIGEVEYDLSNGVPYPFEQDLASIDVREFGTPSFTRLGSIHNRIVCSLDLEHSDF